MQNHSNREITFATQLKTALSKETYCFGFALSRFLIEVSHYFINQSEVKPKPMVTYITRMRFPALGSRYMY